MRILKLFETKQKSILDTEFVKYANTHYEGDFWCFENQLTSLEGAPSSISGDFWCFENQLTSLEGAPTEVGGDFWCSKNELTSLNGAPNSISGDFWCFENQLTSLEGIHKQIKQIGGEFDATKNPIKSHVLGLLLISELKRVRMDNKAVTNILNKYLGNEMTGVLAAQEELIDAGFEDFAQL